MLRYDWTYYWRPLLKRLKGLKERNFGLFEGESEDLNPNFDDFGYDDLFPHYGGERKEDVQKRLKETLSPSNKQKFLSFNTLIFYNSGLQ